MSFLFKIEGKKVFPNEETLLIFPFSKIWDRDTSESKEVAIKEFAYIEFMSSQLNSNPYKGYSSKVREIKLKEDIINNVKWKPDDLIGKAIDKINEFQTNGSESYTLLQSAIKAKEKVEDFFNNFDLNTTTDKGSLVLKPKDVTTAIVDLDKVVTTLRTLKKKVEEDIFDTIKTKANKTISPFANPDSLK